MALWLTAGSAWAASTGFNQAGAGPWDYNTAGNWVGGTINGLWDTSLTLGAAQTVTFATGTSLGAGLTFNYAGNYALTLQASASGTQPLTLGGGISLATPGGTSASVTLGNASNHLTVDLGGVARTMAVGAGRTLTLVDVVSNGGIIKTDVGTLTLSGANTYAGGTTLNAGTLQVGNGAALGAAASALTISGGLLDSSAANLTLSNNNPHNWNGDFVFAGSQNLNTGTGTVTLGATRQVAVNRNTLTIGGVIGDGGNVYGLTLTGRNGFLDGGGRSTGTLTLTGACTFTGAVTIHNCTLVADTVSNGTIFQSSSSLNFTGSGTFQFKGLAGQVRSQTLNGLTLTTGAAVVDANNTGTSATIDLRGTVGTLTISRSAGAVVDFKATAGTFGTTAVVKVHDSNNANTGIIGPWATVSGGADWAINNGSDVVAAYAGYNTLSGAGPTIASSQYANYRVTSGSTGNPTLAATGTIDINTLRINDATARTIDVRNGTTQGILRFGPVGGILTSGGAHVVGVATTAGTITAGGATADAAGELIVNNATALTINSAIANNGAGAVSLTKTGAGNVTLASANTYTGGTTVNAGGLLLGHNNALGPSGTVTVNPGAVLGTASGGTRTIPNGTVSYVWNGDWATYNSAGNIDFGNGAVTINVPLTLQVANGVTIGGAITGPGGLNAFDVTGVGMGGVGYTFTLNGNVLLRANQPVTAGRGAVYGGVISDGGNGYGLTIGGGGSNWALTGANTFTGTLKVEAGTTVQIGNNTATGSLSLSAPIVVNGTLKFYRNNTITQGSDFNSVISGVGGITQQGGTTVLNGANTYVGVTTTAGGTLSFNSIANAGSSSPIGAYPTAGAAGISLGGGTFRYTGATAASDRGFTMTASTTFDVNAAGSALTLGACTLAGNTLTVSGGAGSSLTLGAVTLTGNATLSPAINFTVPSVSGAFALTKAGAGTLFLSGACTHSGGTTLTAGALNINHDNNLGTGALTFNGGTLQFATGSTVTIPASRAVILNSGTTGTVDTSLAGGTIASAITGAGNLTKTGNNTLTLNGLNTFTGNTTISGGKIALGNAAALANSAYVTTGSTGAIGLDVTGYASVTLGGLSGAVSLATAITGYGGLTGLTLNVALPSSSLSYSGIIADGTAGMTLTKTGPGTQILTGANTYTGATTINGGVLRIDSPGSTHASSAVSVTGGGLGGTGTIGGSITVSGTGAIDLRSTAVGNLTVSGGLAFTGAAGANSLYFDLGTGATADKVTVSGAVTVSNPVTVRLNQLSAPGSRLTAGTYDLLTTATGMLPAIGNFTLLATRAFGQTFNLALDGTSTKLQLTSTQLVAGPAAAWWGGTSDGNWSTAGNWYTGVATGAGTGAAPSYQSNVGFYTTTPTAGNLSLTLDADADINSLTFAATATSPVTIGGSRTLAIEAYTFNGNASGNGITANTPTSGTVTHTIGANVGLAANQTWTVNYAGVANNATLTIGGNVTDFGLGYTLTKAGAGVLNLNGNTTLGGLVTAANANAGTIVAGSGASLSVGYGPGSTMTIGNRNSSVGVLDATLASSVRVNVGVLSLGLVASTDQNSSGTLKLGLNNTVTASSYIGMALPLSTNPGELAFLTTANNSTTTIYTPLINMGGFYGNATFVAGAGSSLTIDGINGGRAAIVLNDHVRTSWSQSNADMVDLSGGAASLRLSSLRIVPNANNTGETVVGTVIMSANATNHLDVSNAGSPVIIGSGSAGTVNATLTIGNSDAASAVASTDNGTAILLATRTGGTINGTLNLNGGTLTITTTGTAIGGGGGTSYLNLNGATLKAGASSSTFLNNLSYAYVYAGGVSFDTAGSDITVPQALLGPVNGGYGLPVMATLTPTAPGSGYTSAPTVTFGSPGSGTAATGVATINAAGQVTGVVVASSGSGYTSGQSVSVTISGGGGSSATFANTSATVAQSGGGLTKLGAGMLTLTGANTYTGVSTLNAGTVNLGVAETPATSGPLGKSAASNPGSIVLGGGTLQHSAANQNDYSGRFSTAAGQKYYVDTNGQSVQWATALTSAGGVLAKSGAGTLTLSAVSTYAGDTTVSAGTLALAAAGGLKFIVTDSAANKLTGAGAATLNGTFTVDFSAVTLTSGTWTLVDVATPTYGGTFSVSGFDDSDHDGVWSRVSGDNLWKFSQATGQLTLEPNALPVEIVVEQPLGTDLPDGGSRSFGSVEFSLSASLTFTIRNIGGQDLTGLVITKDGTDAADFNVTVSPTAPVPPSGSTTFTVQFVPGAIGAKSAALHIASNDGDENPFDINLSGTCIARQPHAYTWTPTAANTYSWNAIGNWDNGNFYPDLADDVAGLNINLAGAQTVDLNETITVGTLNLGDTAGTYFATTIAGSGGSLVMEVGSGSASIAKAAAGNSVTDTISADILLNDDVVVNNAASGALVLSGVLSGSGKGLTKTGTGALSLWGANLYSGATTVSAGTLQLGDGTSGHDGSIADAGGIENNSALVYNLFGASSYGGSISGTGSLTKSGAGTLTLTGASSYSGVTTVSAGTLEISAVQNAGVNSPIGAYATPGAAGLLLGGVTLRYTGVSGGSSDRGFTLGATGTVDVSPAGTAVTLGACSIGAYTLNVTGGSGSSLGLGAVTLTGAATLNPTTANLTIASIGGAQNLALGGTATGCSVAGGISLGTASLTKTGAGTWTLGGSSTAGSLYVGYNATTTAGRVVLGSGATLSVGSGAASSLYVGWRDTGTSGAGIGTVDASLAATFVASVGKVEVGGTTGSTGYLYLGADNTITAATEFSICKGTWGGPNGYGTVTNAAGGSTLIYTPLMYVGHNTPNGTTGGCGKFILGAGATLGVEGISGGRTALAVGIMNGGNGASEAIPSSMDLSGGSASLKLSSLVIGQRISGRNSGETHSGIVTLGAAPANHLDISGPGNVIVIGSGSGNASYVTGTLTVGNLDATSAVTSTDGSTAILIAYKGDSGTPTGTLNLLGGTLAITTTGKAIAGGGGTGRLNLNGGATLKAGASSTNWISGLTSATITNSATLDTAGFDIAVPQIFSGPGRLTKAGAGTLVLTGANTFTGPIVVAGGTLGGVRAGVGGGAITNQATLSPGTSSFATFAHTGKVALEPGGTLAVDLGGSSNDVLAVTGAVTVGGTLAIETNGVPLSESEYPIITGTSVSGTFSATTGLPDDCTVVYEATRVLIVYNPSSIPNVPANLTAEPANQRVMLHWDAAYRALAYNVWRSAVDGGPYAKIVSNYAGTAYTNTGLVNGTPYYYVVSATNDIGESAYSGQAGATPNLTAPPTPAGLSALAGYKAIGLSWNASLDAVAYRVKRSLSSGGVYAVVGTTAGTRYVDLGLTNGTPYYYVVSATNSVGESTNSVWVSATPAVPASVNGSWITDGDGNWSQGFNWANGIVAAGTAGTASFTNALTTTPTVTVDFTPWLINKMVFANTGVRGFTIAGGTLEMAGTAPTITVNPASTATVASAMLNTAGLTKAGTGTLRLNGSTSVGSLSIAYNTSASAGTVILGSGASLSVGTGAASTFCVGWGSGSSGNGAGTLDASLASTVTADVGNLMVGGTCGGTGILNLGADNTLTAATQFGISKGSWGGPNGYGTVTTAAGSSTTLHTPLLYVGYNEPNGTTGGWGKLLLGAGGTLALDGVSGGRTALTVGMIGGWNGAGDDTPSLMDLSGGGSGVASLALSALLIGQKLGGGANAYGALTISGSPANHLDISGAGNVVLVGDNGGTGIAGGTLTIGSLDATSAIVSTDNSTAILLANRRSTGPTLGTMNLLGGTLTIATGGKAIAGGGGTSRLNLGGGATLKAGASSTNWISGLTSATITNSATIDSAGFNLHVPQSFSGPGRLTKAGAGTLYLTGGNSFSGPLTVAAGTLGGTRGSTGGGALTNSATLSPGMSVGTFAHTGPAVLRPSGTLRIEIDGAVADTLAVGGTATLGGTLQIVTNGTPVGAPEFSIVTATGGVSGRFAATNGLPPSWRLVYEANRVAVAIPVTDPPAVINAGATVTGLGTATLNGEFAGAARGKVTICWGTADGGTVSPAHWQCSTNLGQQAGAAFAANARGLLYPLTYVYRVYATNDYGHDWSDPATAFTQTFKPGSLPVTDGLIVRLDAGRVDPTDTVSEVRIAGSDVFVKRWDDASGNSHHASNATEADQPLYIAGALNGRAVIRFAQDTDDNGDRLYLGDLSANFPAAASVFSVATIDSDGRYNLFGNRSVNDERWVANSWNESRPGSFRGARSSSANFTLSDWPQAGSHIFLLDNSAAGQYRIAIDGTDIGTDTPDYNSGSGATWTIANRSTSGQQLRGDIAEMLLYNRVLSAAEADAVGGYLEAKYGVSSAYPAPATAESRIACLGATNITGTAGWINARLSCTGAVYDVWAHWGAADGAWTGSARVGRFTNGTFTATHRITGLGWATTTWYTFRASNALDQFWATSSTNFVTLRPPDAPAGLIARRGDTNIRLSWTASALADFYNVKRAGVSGGPYATVGVTAGTTFTNSGLANGVTYFYVVTATNVVGESGNSNEASATPGPMVTDVTWINASGGLWSEELNWTPNGPVPDAAAILNYNVAGTYASTQDMDTAFLINRLNLSAPQLTLTGNSIQFGGAAPQINQNGASSVSIACPVALGVDTAVAGAGGGPVSLAGAVSGAGGLTKSSSGTLTLSAANTFGGSTLVSSGTLAVRNNLALQNSAVDTSGAGVLDVAGYPAPTFGGLTGSKALASLITTGYGSVTNVTLKPATGATRTYSGLIANGAAAMTLTKSGGGTQILSANNAYTGVTRINAGTLTMSGNNTQLTGGATGAGTLRIGTGALIYFGNILTVADIYMEASSVLEFACDIGSGTSVGTMTLLNGANPVPRISSHNVFDNVYLLGNVQINRAGNNNVTTFRGAEGEVFDLGNATRTLTCPGGEVQIYSVVRSGGLVKAGGGNLHLWGANTFSGGLTVSTGNLFAHSAAALGTGTVTINAGTGINTYGVTMTSPAGYVFNGSFSAYNTAANTYLGNAPITLSAPITITVANGFSAGGTITGPGGLNAFDITLAHWGGTTYSVTLDAPIVLRGNQTVTMDGWTTTYNGVISDGGHRYGFTKAGAGTMLLTAAGTYGGTTVVSAGTLQVSGAGRLGTGGVTVSAGVLRLSTGTGDGISDAGALEVGSAATVQLDSNETVGLLYLGGQYRAAGTWGAIGGGAANQDSHFSGAGILTVLLSEPPSTVILFR